MMTDDDRAKRIRTAALTVAVFAASGGAVDALFQAFRGGTRPLQRRCDARWGTG
jgi:hypothetical protein